MVATLGILLVLAALVALGGWQLQRRAWKTALIGRVEALQSAPAEPLQAVLNRLSNGGSVDFVRVQTRCEGLGAHVLHLYGLRAAGPAWRQITACRLPAPAAMLTGSTPRYRSILVDLGFENEPPGSPGRTEAVSLPHHDALVVGVLRTPDPPPWYTPVLGPARTPGGGGGDAGGEWMRRDVAPMAAELGAPAVAPFMLTLEAPRAGPRLIPSPLPTDIPNRHFEYALTWFGLALVLVGFYLGAFIRGGRRR